MDRASAVDRARRLIALLGRFENDRSIPLATLAEELDCSAAELADDLTTLSMCGVAPYSPYELVPVSVEDGRITFFGSPPALTSPVRLSLGEAEALTTALSAAGFGAADPMMQKLASASSTQLDADDLARTLHTSTPGHDTQVFERLAAAVGDNEVVVIDYQRDEDESPRERTVEPLQLFTERGAWYLSAWCREAGGRRTFRVDRVRDIAGTGERFDPTARDVSDSTATAFSGDDLPLATLRFARAQEFVAREWPGGRLVETPPDGSALVEVPFGGTDWIARRVTARLGSVEVVAPPQVSSAVAAFAASKPGL